MICYSFRLRHSIPQNGAQLALTTLLHQECPWPVQALAEPAYDVPTLKFFWKNITYYMYIKRGRFNTPLSEKTKMSVCFWFYDAKKRKAIKKCSLGESLNWNWTKKKKKENCRRLTFKEENLQAYSSCGSHGPTWSTPYKFEV